MRIRPRKPNEHDDASVSETSINEADTLTPQQRVRIIILVVLLFCTFFFFRMGSVAEESGIRTQSVQKIRSSTLFQNNSSPLTTDILDSVDISSDKQASSCSTVCSTKLQVKYHGDLLDRNDLLRMATEGKKKLLEKLSEEYGEYMEKIFIGPGKSFTPVSQVSMERLKRKLTIKILQMQAKVKTLLARGCSENFASEDCFASLEGDDDLHGKFMKYVWANGGHSSSAGHGNLYNESKTAVMGRDARLVFDTVGIHFEDRNAAMGGTSSGSEISSCWEQVFGADVDFFTWDYGMTDGKQTEKMLHYGYRGGISPGKPAIMGLSIAGRSSKQRQEVLEYLETYGMAAFMGSEESYEARNVGIPDSAAGLTNEQIEDLPPMVRNFRCGEMLEHGDPFCGSEKYTKYACHPRKKQAKWHPGFKHHAMEGHALALFLVDALIESLSDLIQNPGKDVGELLKSLQEEDDELFERIKAAELPSNTMSNIFKSSQYTAEDLALNLSTFWKGENVCRIAVLPSQSRYLGYATNTGKVGGDAFPGTETFDTGVEIAIAKGSSFENNGKIALVYEKKDRESCEEALVRVDHKDFFYVNDSFGRASITIPNEKEINAYRYDPKKISGLILISFSICDWGKCPASDLRSQEQFAAGKFEIEANGQRVTELVSVGNDLWLLKGEEGVHFKANSNGLYELSFIVHEKEGVVRLSSIILY